MFVRSPIFLGMARDDLVLHHLDLAWKRFKAETGREGRAISTCETGSMDPMRGVLFVLGSGLEASNQKTHNISGQTSHLLHVVS